MSSMPHSTDRAADSSAAHNASLHCKTSWGERVTMFLTAPILAFAYYTVVSVMKIVSRDQA